MEKSEPRFTRVLLKISGEILGSGEKVLSFDSLNFLASEIKKAKDEINVELALVVGGGNIVRGKELLEAGIERVKGDYMGMLATIINSLALQSVLKGKGVDSLIMSAIEIEGVVESFNRDRAIDCLKKGLVLLFASGTGNPYFTTDTAAALRAAEIGAHVVLKGTKVDGVYSGDPLKDPGAKKLDEVSFETILERNLGIIDQTAAALLRENSIPLVVFNMRKEDNLLKILRGEKIGTLVR